MPFLPNGAIPNGGAVISFLNCFNSINLQSIPAGYLTIVQVFLILKAVLETTNCNLFQQVYLTIVQVFLIFLFAFLQTTCNPLQQDYLTIVQQQATLTALLEVTAHFLFQQDYSTTTKRYKLHKCIPRLNPPSKPTFTVIHRIGSYERK
jgi:hypothetical protein